MTSTLLVLRLLCPASAPVEDYARLLDIEAARVGITLPYIQGILMFREPGCRAKAVGAAGEIGLMQIKPGTRAAQGYPRARLFDPALNIRLGSEHLAWAFDLCGNLGEALATYNGVRNCPKNSGYATRFMGTLRRLRKFLGDTPAP